MSNNNKVETIYPKIDFQELHIKKKNEKTYFRRNPNKRITINMIAMYRKRINVA